MAKTVRIGELQVKLGRQLGIGCERRGFDCNYTKNGKQYIVKEARDYGGFRSNLLEYHIFQKLKKDRAKKAKLYPDFEAISKNGKFLLVEKCVIAQKVHKSDSYNFKEKFFGEEFFYDDHNENWGYTLKENRPVIIDMAYGMYRFEELISALGIKIPLLKKLKKFES